MKKEENFGKLLKEAKKELLSKKARLIISKYKRHAGKFQNAYNSEWLSVYYSPILVALRKYLGKDLKKRSILEVGYGLPLFIFYLKSVGSNAVGIDIDPYITGKDLYRMSVEHIRPSFKKQYRGHFDAIVERIALSNLYDKNYFNKTGKHKFKNKRKILSDLAFLLKDNGFLILQDDRGSVFSEKELKAAGFKRVIKLDKIIFHDRKRNYLGWNTLAVYKKN